MGRDESAPCVLRRATRRCPSEPRLGLDLGMGFFNGRRGRRPDLHGAEQPVHVVGAPRDTLGRLSGPRLRNTHLRPVLRRFSVALLTGSSLFAVAEKLSNGNSEDQRRQDRGGGAGEGCLRIDRKTPSRRKVGTGADLRVCALPQPPIRANSPS